MRPDSHPFPPPGLPLAFRIADYSYRMVKSDTEVCDLDNPTAMTQRPDFPRSGAILNAPATRVFGSWQSRPRSRLSSSVQLTPGSITLRRKIHGTRPKKCHSANMIPSCASMSSSRKLRLSKRWLRPRRFRVLVSRSQSWDEGLKLSAVGEGG
jgi:hypothetical protein